MLILFALNALALATTDYQIPDPIEGCTEANDIRDQMIEVKAQADEAADKNVVHRANLETLLESQEMVNAIEDSLKSRSSSFLQAFDVATPISLCETLESSQMEDEVASLNTLLTELSVTRDTTKAMEYVNEIQELLESMISQTQAVIAANSEIFETAYSETLPELEKKFYDVEC